MHETERLDIYDIFMDDDFEHGDILFQQDIEEKVRRKYKISNDK